MQPQKKTRNNLRDVYYHEAQKILNTDKPIKVVLNDGRTIEYRKSTKSDWEKFIREKQPDNPLLPENIDKKPVHEQPQRRYREKCEILEIFPNQEMVDPETPWMRSITYSSADYLHTDILNEHTLENFKYTARGLLKHVSEHVLLKDPHAKFQVALMGHNKQEICMTPQHASVQYIMGYVDRMFDECVDKYDNRQGLSFNQHYQTINSDLEDPHLFRVAWIRILYAVGLEERVRGMHHSIITAHEKWHIVDSPTIKNCVFVAIYTALNWQSNTRLLTDATYRMDCARNFKRSIGIIDDAPTIYDLNAIATNRNITIDVYDNVFDCQVVGDVSAGKKKVSIQIMDGHATALIPKDAIKALLPDFEFKNTTMSTHDKKNTIIRPMKAEQHYIDKFMAWDVETYLDTRVNPYNLSGGDREFHVYCSGVAYYKPQDVNAPPDTPREIITHQIYDDDHNLEKFVDYLKQNIDLFADYTLYAHNGGKFDVILLLRDVLFNDKDIQILDNGFIELNNSLIGLSMKYKGKRLHFKDSYRMFQSGLMSLTKDMKVETPKMEIDHSLITKDTFRELADKIKPYHIADCKGLLQCLDKFSRFIYITYKINLVKCYTTASLSKKIILTKFYPRSKHRLYALSDVMDAYIRRAYQGGRNECFQLGIIYAVFYYDIASMYPAMGLKYLPVGEPTFITKDTQIAHIGRPLTTLDVLKLFPLSFMHVVVRGTREMLGGKRPLHGVRRDGKFMFPYIDTPTEMHLYSEEIEYGLSLGYTYDFISALGFFKGKILAEFFAECYEGKRQAGMNHQEALKFMWKILLNSGYGCWGFNPYNKDTLKLLNGKTSWLEYYDQNRLKSVHIGQRYTIARVLNEIHATNTSVALSASISSNGRIRIHQIISDIEALGGKVYYTDTDSVMCDLKLSDYPELVKKYRTHPTGDNIGDLKNELGIKDGEDLAYDCATIAGCKMYTIAGMDANGNLDIRDKLKGCNADTIFHDGKPIDRYSAIEKIITGESVSQVQTLFACNKTDILRDGNNFNIRVAPMEKSFRQIYTKGIVNDDWSITPFTI